MTALPRKSRDPAEGLPDDLARVLRDPSIVVQQDMRVWELIGGYGSAPSSTASAGCSICRQPFVVREGGVTCGCTNARRRP